MSQQEDTQEPALSEKGDGYADAIATVVIIAIVVTTVVFWLKSLTGGTLF